MRSLDLRPSFLPRNPGSDRMVLGLAREGRGQKSQEQRTKSAAPGTTQRTALALWELEAVPGTLCGAPGCRDAPKLGTILEIRKSRSGAVRVCGFTQV